MLCRVVSSFFSSRTKTLNYVNRPCLQRRQLFKKETDGKGPGVLFLTPLQTTSHYIKQLKPKQLSTNIIIVANSSVLLALAFPSVKQ